jgi:hypothetical protein
MAGKQTGQPAVEKRDELQTADYINSALLLLCYLALIIFSRLYTIHPLDDDWSYIRAAETFYQTGQMQFTPWTSPSLIFQVLWGALFCQVLGFSANTLIVSTLASSSIGMVFFYLLLREAGWKPAISLCLCLLCIVNPFSFPLLFTFFTDHHFLSLMQAALFFYYRGARRESIRCLALGSVFTALAILVRQQGLLLAAGAGLYFLGSGRKRGTAALQAIVSLALPMIVFGAYSYWFSNVHGPTYTSLQQWQWMLEDLQSPLRFLSKALHRPFLILEFLGLCLIPLSMSLLPAPGAWLRRRQTLYLLLFCSAGVALYLLEHAGLYSSIYTWMNGFHFAYVSEYGYRGAEHALQLWYKIIDFLALFSIVILICCYVKERKNISRRAAASPLSMLLLMGALQVLYLLIVRYKFTRYYLVIVPFFILCGLDFLKQRTLQKKYLVPLLALFAGLSFMGTQDFLSFNEARWKLGGRLLKSGIPARTLSAGFPFDCWHNMDYCRTHPADIVPQKYDIPWWFEELLPAMDAQYVISSSPVPSGFYYLKYFCTDRYAVIESVTYYSLFYLKDMPLYVLKRETPAAPVPEGKTYYRFIDNLSGARVLCSSPAGRIQTGVRNSQRTLAQPAGTQAIFRLSLPYQPCRIRFSLNLLPQAGGEERIGAMAKIYLNTNLFENFFDVTGMVGTDQQMSFIKPRSYFLRQRTLYLQYLSGSYADRERAGEEITLDMSRFSGMTIEIIFSAETGPQRSSQSGIVQWGEPVIETY